MIRSKFGLKAFGLCALVLGLMEFAAGAAQAETGAKWLVNGKDVGDLLPQLVVKEVENKTASISWSTKGGTKVLFLCTSTEFDTGGLLTSNGGVSTGNVSFKGCVTFLNGTPSPSCKPFSRGKPLGEILSLKGKGLIVLDKEDKLLLLVMKEGKLELEEVFDKISELIKVFPLNASGEITKVFGMLSLGEECSIGEQVNVETTELGEGVWGKDIGGDAGFLTELVTHLMVEALQKLRVLGQPAIVLGSAIIELGGAHKGLKWSGVPG
jgi:hypothetical protein